MAILIDFHVLAQTITYTFIAICGLAMAVPMGVIMTEENHACMLYMDWTWDSYVHFTAHPGPRANCNYVMYLAIFGGIVKGTGMTVYCVWRLSQKDPNIGAKMWVLPNVLISAAFTVAFFIAACIDSVGFKVLCDGFLAGKDQGRKFETCSDLREFTWVDTFGDHDHHNGKTVYNFFLASMLASWSMVLLWLVQTGLGIGRVVRNRRMAAQGMDASAAGTSDLQRVAA